MALTKITSNVVKDDAVTSAKIVDGGIATADIADNAVTSTKIAQNSILTKHIDDGQVTTDQLGADAVTSAKIADDAISEEHLDVTVITSLSEVTAATGDLLMIADISDSNNLKKIPVSSILAGNAATATTAGTVTTAAQTNITSLGTLTTLTVDDIIIDGSGIKASRIGRSTTDTAQANINFWDYNHASYPGHVHIVANSTGSDGSSHDSGEIKFWVNSGSFVQTMTIDKAGSVGIGTNSPTSWASYTDSAATVLQISDTSERARVVINGGNGAHLDLVDHVGGTDDKHMNIAVDGGILKFGSLNDAGNAFVQNNIMIMDLGTGHVGIGTPPTNIIHTSTSSNNVGRFESTDATAYIQINDTDDSLYITTAGQKGSFGGNASVNDNNLNIDLTNGNVGIGTTSPGTPLTISNLDNGTSFSSNRVLQLIGTSTTDGSRVSLAFTGNTSIGNGLAIIEAVNDDQSAGHTSLHMHTYNGSWNTENLVLKGGNVGIGTDDPNAKLHIGPLTGGNGTAQERLRISGDYSAAGSGSLIRFTNQHNSGTNPNSGEYNIAGIKAFDFRSDWGGALALQTAPNTNTGGNLTDRLVIDPEGRIGIGNSTPGSNHAKANNLVVGSGSAGGIAVYNALNEGWYAFSRDNANNTDAYDGGMSYDGDRNLRLHTNAGSERLKIGGDGLATFTSTRSEWAMRINTAGNRGGIVFDKPGTTSIMGSVLMLASDETFRLGTASYYHVRMDQSGNTYMGNSGTTRFGSTGNLSVNTTTMNSGITSGTDVRALGPCFANDANSFTMSQEGTGNANAYLAARGPNSSTRGNIHIGVSVSGGGGFKSGLVVDNQGRSTSPENPGFRARGTSAQTLSSGWQTVGYNSLYDQTGSSYSTTNSRFTAPVAGWYQFNAAWTANNNSDSDGTLAIWINGSSSDLVSSTSMPNTGGSYDGHFCSGCCYLDVNDYVDVHRYSTVSTTTRSSQSYGGWFSGILIG